MKAQNEHRPDLVGDGYDDLPLYDAKQVGKILGIPWKAVYDLPIASVRISERRIRWRPAVVREFIDRRTQEA